MSFYRPLFVEVEIPLKKPVECRRCGSTDEVLERGNINTCRSCLVEVFSLRVLMMGDESFQLDAVVGKAFGREPIYVRDLYPKDLIE